MNPEPTLFVSGHLELEHVGHLARLTVWGLVSLASGFVFLLRDRRSGFGAMTAGWGFVNVLIVIASLRSGPITDLLAEAEGYRRFPLLNLGLNVVWLGIGFAMFRNRRNAWVSHAGLAMILQAIVLQALDLFLSTRIAL